MKFLYNLVSFIFLLSFTSCDSQDVFPNDLELQGVKGSPKKIVESSTIFPQGTKQKSVSYFNKEGNITKLEEHHIYDINEETHNLSSITYFKYLSNSNRTSITYSQNERDTIKLGNRKFLDRKSISTEQKEYKGSKLSEVLVTLDSENRVVLKETKFIDTVDNSVIFQSSTELIYSENELDKLIVKNNRIKSEGEITTVSNKKFDDKGNILSCEYYDESKNLVYSIKYEYEY